MQEDKNKTNETEQVKNEAQEQQKDTKQNPNTNKPTWWKTLIAFAIIFAIGYGVGFGTIALVEMGKDNDDPTQATCGHETDISDIFSEADKKPIIYLYPTEETDVSVTLSNPELITVSYPSYKNGWKVTAHPDGTLIHNGKELYSLYYECSMKNNPVVTREGFTVHRNDLVEFMEEKLGILGLNDREVEEFIIYWLPVLQEHEYLYIRFATQEEIDSQMQLNVSPAQIL